MDIFAIAGYASLVVSSIIVIFSRVPKQTIQDQRELINTLQEQRAADKEQSDARIKALEDQHDEDTKMHFENAKAIADLQGQVKIYKELALQDMAKSMTAIAETNQKILELLSTSTIVDNHELKK